MWLATDCDDALAGLVFEVLPRERVRRSVRVDGRRVPARELDALCACLVLARLDVALRLDAGDCDGGLTAFVLDLFAFLVRERLRRELLLFSCLDDGRLVFVRDVDVLRARPLLVGFNFVVGRRLDLVFGRPVDDGFVLDRDVVACETARRPVTIAFKSVLLESSWDSSQTIMPSRPRAPTYCALTASDRVDSYVMNDACTGLYAYVALAVASQYTVQFLSALNRL